MDGKKPIAFAANGRLIPCGELKPHEIRLIDKKISDYIYPVCIWIDEAGLLWAISGSAHRDTLRPMKWPTDIHATYVIGYVKHQDKDAFVKGSVPLVADSYEQALQKFRKHMASNNRPYEESSVHLAQVSKA